MTFKARRILIVTLATASLALLAACGGGASGAPAQPAASGFTNSALSGTYAFEISGTNAGGFYAVAGNFQANGSGGITGGTVDVNSPGTIGILSNQPISSGSYNLRSDGRGIVTLTSSNATIGTFNLEIALANSQTGVAIRFDSNVAGSGTIDMQTSSAFSLPSLAGALVFNVSGVDDGQNSEAAAGLLNVDSAGNIPSGISDDNDSGAVSSGVPIAAESLAVSAPNSLGRGAIIVGARNFAYYIVDSTHLKVVEIGGPSVLAGDVFRQQSATISGSFVFTITGVTNAGNGIFLAGGILNTDGNGNILNTSEEDLYNGGTLTQAAVTTGSYSLSGGRATLSLNGALGTLTFAAYPTTGGLQLVELDSSVQSSGVALAQSGAPFSNSSLNGGLVFNFSGATSSAEIDSVAQLTANGNGSFSGALDLNNGGATSSSLSTTGTYSLAASGRGTAMLTNSIESVNIIFYMASNNRILFFEPDSGQVSAGVFIHQ